MKNFIKGFLSIIYYMGIFLLAILAFVYLQQTIDSINACSSFTDEQELCNKL